MTKQKMFGTDGVRAQVGTEPMTPQTIMRLAHAAGHLLSRRHSGRKPRPVVAVGTDTRGSAPMFEAALQAGFSAAGVDTVMCGELPTPGVAYVTRMRGYQAGVVVSASHNPFDDNGIKFFSSTGDKLPDDLEAEIEQAMDQPMVCKPSSQLGRVSHLPEAADLYIEFCRQALPRGVDLRGMKVVVDAAHGACHRIAPAVFRQLGAHVVAVGVSPDGQNINDRVGATAPKHLSRAVQTHHADESLALLKSMKPLKKKREEELNLALEPYREELLKASKNGNSKTALIEFIFRITRRRITYKKLDEILADSTVQLEVAK